jgi:mannose-6-phosphate isomerase-like protein (cupin superfamily)
MKKLRITDVNPSASRLLPDLLGDSIVTGGGLYIFKPGETAHPEAVHVHEVNEVFIFVQGKGVIPINGVDHPVQAGDIVIVEAGEDHHTRSSENDPLVAAWYVMSK